MDLGSILVILALSLLVGWYVSRPFFERHLAPEIDKVDPAEHERSSLMAERDRILNALQELDFDAALGKIPDEDYPTQRAMLMKRGADILRKLDAMHVIEGGALAGDGAAETRLEAAIAARRADAVRRAGNGHSFANGRSAAPALVKVDDELESILAERRRARQEKAAGFCPKCGKPVQKSDRFCPKCGGKIS